MNDANERLALLGDRIEGAVARDGRAGVTRGRRAVVGLVAATVTVVVGLGALAASDRSSPAPEVVDVRSGPARADEPAPSTAPPPSPADDPTAAAVAQGMEDGALVFVGTEPSCVVVRVAPSPVTAQPVEFACDLSRLPTAEELVDHTGVLQTYVDDEHRVAGACRGQDRDGRRWICLAGEAAVEAGYIARDLLGRPQPVPGRG